jgi:hypothetical protein
MTDSFDTYLPAGSMVKGTAMNIAMIAAHVLSRSGSDDPPAQSDRDETVGSNRPRHRAPRTKAARAINALAVLKVIAVLDRSRVPYTQPILGKFVVEPHPGVAGSKTIVFWAARNRLRIGQRATQTRGIHAFQQSLADQGHPILGYLSRAKPPEPPTMSSAERRRAHLESNLAEMAQAYDERMAFFRQSLDPDNKIRTRDPRSARVRRLFRRAWLRPV